MLYLLPKQWIPRSLGESEQLIFTRKSWFGQELCSAGNLFVSKRLFSLCFSWQRDQKRWFICLLPSRCRWENNAWSATISFPSNRILLKSFRKIYRKFFKQGKVCWFKMLKNSESIYLSQPSAAVKQISLLTFLTIADTGLLSLNISRLYCKL